MCTTGLDPCGSRTLSFLNDYPFDRPGLRRARHSPLAAGGHHAIFFPIVFIGIPDRTGRRGPG
ncbi:hypothetical protein DESC_90036 [Desulfosarcina cetonica]|nr:hypothetical protein DESC_90036 [Desulfosarcina cetonica]